MDLLCLSGHSVQWVFIPEEPIVDTLTSMSILLADIIPKAIDIGVFNLHLWKIPNINWKFYEKIIQLMPGPRDLFIF